MIHKYSNRVILIIKNKDTKIYCQKVKSQKKLIEQTLKNQMN